jgi:hypothetical protein
MRMRVDQMFKFVGLALAVVFLGPGVELGASQDGQS